MYCSPDDCAVLPSPDRCDMGIATFSPDVKVKRVSVGSHRTVLRVWRRRTASSQNYGVSVEIPQLTLEQNVVNKTIRIQLLLWGHFPQFCCVHLTHLCLVVLRFKQLLGRNIKQSVARI